MIFRGIKKAVSDLKGLPDGCHCQIWCQFSPDRSACEIWTGQTLTAGESEHYHGVNDRYCLDSTISEIAYQARESGDRLSLSECIRQAVYALLDDISEVRM